MKMNLYDPKTGALHRIHHHDAQGWIENGYLTSPPDLTPIVEDEPEAIAPKKKAQKIYTCRS
jgi:hypothetical protein